MYEGFLRRSLLLPWPCSPGWFAVVAVRQLGAWESRTRTFGGSEHQLFPTLLQFLFVGSQPPISVHQAVDHA